MARLGEMRLILASGSPRRRELLAQAGYVFAVQPADVDESVRAGEAAGDYVRRLAEEKAKAVYQRFANPTLIDKTDQHGAPGLLMAPQERSDAQPVFARLVAQESSGAPSSPASSARVGYTNAPLMVMGADTTVVCDGKIVAKPADAEDAKRMLRKLSGQTHEVLTGIALVTRAEVVSEVETTSVTFISIPEDELDFYCSTAEPMDKAGAYGIQGYAARWIPRIDGCYFNVMGLPIARVVRMIEAAAGFN